MTDVTLTVDKNKVYDEVAKTTSYTGAKMQGDDKAYERIFTTDEDQQMLERFWTEASNAATEQFKPFLESNLSDSSCYKVQLELSSSFETQLQASIETSLFSFFVAVIVGKWYKFTNKSEAESYTNEAVGMIEDVMQKIYFKKKPKRVIPQ